MVTLQQGIGTPQKVETVHHYPIQTEEEVDEAMADLGQLVAGALETPHPASPTSS